MSTNQAAELLCYSLFHQTSRSIDIPPPASCDALPGISGADDVIKKTAVVSEASAPVWRGDAGVPNNTSVLFIDQNREVFCASATNSHTLDSLVFHWVSVSCLSLNTYQHQLEPHENSKQVIVSVSLLTLNKEIHLDYMTAPFHLSSAVWRLHVGAAPLYKLRLIICWLMKTADTETLCCPARTASEAWSRCPLTSDLSADFILMHDCENYL